MTNSPITMDVAAVTRLLPEIDVVDEMRRLFTELGQGKGVQPPQSVTLLPHGKGDFITYLGALEGARVFGAKLSPYLVKDGGPTITAWTLLMSMDNGQPLLLCDAGLLTTERTAATTALAVDFLAAGSASRIAIIGAGSIALAHWRHVQALRNWQQVRVFSPSLADDQAKRSEWQAACPHAILASSAEAATREADVVLLCTSSGTPVIDTEALAPGTLVTSISTNVAEAHEVSPAFLNSAQVYCDYRETTPATAGEMILAARDNGWDAASVRGDLAELCLGNCPKPDSHQPVFFRSVGLGLEDIAIANAIYRAA